MVRFILLLVISAGLIIFTLSNLAAVPLVILGGQTPALPLAVWVLGAIAAGALTTLVISGLFKASNAFAVFRESRRSRNAKRSPRQFTTGFAGSPWTSDWSVSNTTEATQTVSSYTATRATSNHRTSGDDWGRKRSLEDWDDWEGYEESVNRPSPQTTYQGSHTVIQDSIYEDLPPDIQDSTPPEPELEEWEDWDGYEESDDRHLNERLSDVSDKDEDYPKRTDFEAKQEPKSSYRSGSIYSYSYREPRDSGVGKAEGVYDAEYRVIIPPHRADPEPGDLDAPKFNWSASEPRIDVEREEGGKDGEDEEDWGFEDDDEFEDDEDLGDSSQPLPRR
jgi:uncharacterized integral membrane protein